MSEVRLNGLLVPPTERFTQYRRTVNLKVIVEVFANCQARCVRFKKVSLLFSDWQLNQPFRNHFKAGSPAVFLICFVKLLWTISALLHNEIGNHAPAALFQMCFYSSVSDA